MAGPGADSRGAEPREDLGDLVVVNVSGRGDKDLETVLEETEKRDLDVAPDMSVLREATRGGGL